MRANQSTGYGGIAGLDGVFQPDVMLSSQWQDLHQSNFRDGEQRLLLAILEQAIDDLHGPLRAKPTATAARLHRLAVLSGEARDWIARDSGPMNFGFVTEALGLEPELLRKRLLTGPAVMVDRRAPARMQDLLRPKPERRR